MDQFLLHYGFVPAVYFHVSHVQPWNFPARFVPMLSSMFLHGGWMHLIGNMWTLWIFGDNVEERMGRRRFLVFYLLTGIIAGITHELTNVDSTVPTVGASGAIAGVLGAYFVLFPHSRIIVLVPIFFFPFFFEVPSVLYLLFWFVSQLFAGTLAGLNAKNVEGVAVWAHAGGFVAGLVLHRFFLLPQRAAPRPFQRDEYGVEGAWTPRVR
jgi:membrane associated rhomboid family serine protease